MYFKKKGVLSGHYRRLHHHSHRRRHHHRRHQQQHYHQHYTVYNLLYDVYFRVLPNDDWTESTEDGGSAVHEKVKLIYLSEKM